MGPMPRVFQLIQAVRFLRRVAVVFAITIVGWLLVQNMVKSGQLPPDPLGLAAMGLPATVFGIPTAYAGGILLLDGLVLFGESGSNSSTSGGIGHVDGDGFDDDGDGGGGGGGGGGE